MECIDSIIASLVFYMALAEGYKGILLFIYSFIFLMSVWLKQGL